jgi:hypothetical protein
MQGLLLSMTGFTAVDWHRFDTVPFRIRIRLSIRVLIKVLHMLEN